MNFEDIKRIYDRRRQTEKKYNFVRDIFSDIRKQYLKEAAAAGKDANQSWNSWSGKAFQKLIEYAVADFTKISGFPVSITNDDELRKKRISAELDQVRRNIVVFYSQFAVVPDADIIIYDQKSLRVIAILSCKASLRERVAQAAYWKLKLQSFEGTQHILCYLISTDNDGDFLADGAETSRDRIIVEYGELDGAYILRDVPESAKIKNFSSMFVDLTSLFKRWFDGHKDKQANS